MTAKVYSKVLGTGQIYAAFGGTYLESRASTAAMKSFAVDSQCSSAG